MGSSKRNSSAHVARCASRGINMKMIETSMRDVDTAWQGLTSRGSNSTQVRKALGDKKKEITCAIPKYHETLVLRTTGAVMQEERRPGATNAFVRRKGRCCVFLAARQFHSQ